MVFKIQPHNRLQEWVAEEKGYFKDEGLEYVFHTGDNVVRHYSSQGSADGSSVPRDNRTGIRGEGSLPLAPRVSLYPGALVLFCGPADRELLSVLISDARPSAMAARFLWSRWKAAVPFSSRNRRQIE